MERLTFIAIAISLVAVMASLLASSPRVRQGATLLLLVLILLELKVGVGHSARNIDLPSEVSGECFKYWHSARMAMQAEVDRFFGPLSVLASGLALLSLTAGIRKPRQRT